MTLAGLRSRITAAAASLAGRRALRSAGAKRPLRRGLAAAALVAALLLAGGLAALLLANHHAAATITLKAADDQALGFPTTEALMEMGRLLERWSDGRIRVEVYYDGQLGNEVTTIRKTIEGSIDIDRVNLDPLTRVEPALAAFAMPYLFKSDDQMHRVIDGPVGRELLDRLARHGLVGLGYYDSGARSFYLSRGPIRTLAALRGLRIRVQNAPIMADIVRSLGAIPVPMPYEDVYAALQTGVIDGAENNIPSWVSTGHYEVAPYYLEDAHVRVPEVLVMSEKSWNRLSPADRRLVTRAAARSVSYQRLLWRKTVAAALAKAKAAGCEILTPEDPAAFRAATERVYRDYGGRISTYIDRIKRTP